MNEPTIYAKRGERVTCESGHHICTLADDVLAGASGPAKCEDWQQPEPAIGDGLSDLELDALENALRATVAQLGPPGKVIEHED